MRSILTIAIIISSLSVMAQGKDTVSVSRIYRDASNGYLYINKPATFIPYSFIFAGVSPEILKISAPDNTKTITVTFSKSQVHFINDSTFTFKQK